MSHLPWLVVHGWWISKLVVVFGAVLVAFVWFALRRAAYWSTKTPRVRASKLHVAVVALISLGVSFYSLDRMGPHLFTPHIDWENRLPTSLAWNDRLSLATAFPGMRENSLRAMEIWFTIVGPSEAAEQQRLELADLMWGCEGRISELLRTMRYEDALAESRDCSSSSHVTALLTAGLYEDARREMTETTPWREQVLAAIAAKDWLGAAKLFEDDSLGGDGRCIGDLLRSFAGEHVAPRHGNSTACRITAFLTGETSEWSVDRDLSGLVFIPVMYGAVARHSGSASESLHLSSIPNIEPWLARFAVESPFKAQQSSVWHVYANDFPSAHAAAQLAGDNWDAVVSLREGTPLPTSIFDDETAIRSGTLPPRVMESGVRPCDDEFQQAFATAIAGDATPVIQAMSYCRIHHADTFLALAPRVAQRAELARATRRGLMYWAQQPEVPFVLVKNLSIIRDIARTTPEADRLQRVIDRHIAAFSTREQIVALALAFVAHYGI